MGGSITLRRSRPPRAGVDVLRLGNEPANDLKGIEHALDVRVSLVLSACSLSHIHCLSHLVGTVNFRLERYIPVTEHTREEVEKPSRR